MEMPPALSSHEGFITAHDLSPRMEDKDALFSMTFRSTSREYLAELPPFIERDGLQKLNASASNQLSEFFWKQVIEKSPKPLYIIDLRRECHGFIKGMPFSWGYSHDHSHNYNHSLSAEQIEELELRLIKRDFSHLEGAVFSEKQLIESLGAHYLRLPVCDHERPLDPEVDAFINLVIQFKDSAWLHLHCAGGKGRTTTFLSMLDMIHNSQALSADAIIKRHASMGGRDLLEVGDPEKRSPERIRQIKERLDFILLFHQYCKENPTFEVTWSDWIK